MTVVDFEREPVYDIHHAVGRVRYADRERDHAPVLHLTHPASHAGGDGDLDPRWVGAEVALQHLAHDLVP
jgi:hypothetical protein